MNKRSYLIQCSMLVVVTAMHPHVTRPQILVLRYIYSRSLCCTRQLLQVVIRNNAIKGIKKMQ